MKKILASLFFCFVLASAMDAQDKALGLKLGNGAQISGQLELGDANRFEANLGLGNRFNYLGVNGYYQWLKDLPQLGSDFKWYYGLGADLGIGNGYFGLGVGGQIGIEYKFPDIPLQLSLDATPTLNLTGRMFLWSGGGVGVRYTF